MVSGFNGAIIAYGQTGSGKTYTMMGEEGETQGVIPRAIQGLFAGLNGQENCSFTVQLGYVQVYMELLQDLLNPESRLKIREDSVEGFSLVGLTWRTVHTVSDACQLLATGNQLRATAFTALNAASSRSHAIVLIRVERHQGEHLVVSTLQLVDLAGSERLSTFTSPGTRLDESKAIGLSLLSLGNCVKALADKRNKHVAYRDSVLTKILANALGGNAYTSFILTISPCQLHTGETLQTLSFGFSALKVETHPSVSKRIDYKAMCGKLQMELNQSKDRYTALAAANGKLETLLKQLKSSLKTQQSDDFEDQIAAKITKNLKDTYEAKLREKDSIHTKLLLDFNQFVTEKDQEIAKLKREKGSLYETLGKIQLGEAENCSISTCLHATEVFQLTEEVESLKLQKNSLQKTIFELESKVEIHQKDVILLQKRLENGQKPLEEDEKDVKIKELTRQIAFFESNSTTLSSKLSDLESIYYEKCEETELLRAELIRREGKKSPNTQKELEMEYELRKKLELEVRELQWEVTRLEKGDRTHVKLIKTLLAHVKDLGTFSMLEAKLNRIWKQPGENSIDMVRGFASEFYLAMHKDARDVVNGLKSEVAALQDQVKIATQLYESQRDQCDQLVRGR